MMSKLRSKEQDKLKLKLRKKFRDKKKRKKLLRRRNEADLQETIKFEKLKTCISQCITGSTE